MSKRKKYSVEFKKSILNIRNIRVEDAPKFLELQQRLDKETSFMLLYPEERNINVAEIKKNIQMALDRNDYFVIVEDKNKLLGYLHAERGAYKKIQHSLYIVVGILQEATGNGLGTAMFKSLNSWSITNGVKRLELTVMTTNKVAQHLYSRMGFKIEGIKSYSIFSQGQYVDEYYMAKVL